jgi:sugar phosphate isomerase/epimerase
MSITRREWLKVGAAAVAAIPSLQNLPNLRAALKDKKRLGIVSYSYHLRMSADRPKTTTANINDPLTFLEHCRELGAGGIQLDLGVRDKSYVARLREKIESNGLYLEGSIRLPRDRQDMDRFTSEVRTAKEAGAQVLRTVMMSGRRYEIFDSLQAFREAADRSWQSLVLAEPIAAKENVRLAIENHKDWRADELADITRRLGSSHVGACVDFGNSIALLEDPMRVVETLAPFAMTTHVKDMGMEEYDRGFLLSEVPLGEGCLALPKMIELLERKNPAIQFNLEMITRDPLSVPCLETKYWATFEKVPGQDLARTLSAIRHRRSKEPLPRIGSLNKDEQLALEEKNVRKCLAFAKENLNL